MPASAGGRASHHDRVWKSHKDSQPSVYCMLVVYRDMALWSFSVELVPPVQQHVTYCMHACILLHGRLPRHGLVVLLRELVPPVQQRLADHRGHHRVVVRPPLLEALVDERALPPPLGAADPVPPPDLPLVVIRTPAQVEPRVPLEPTPGVLGVNPPVLLPVHLVLPRLDPVAIGPQVVPSAQVHVLRQPREPVLRVLLVRHARDALGVLDPGLAPPRVEVAAPEDARMDHLPRGEVWLELWVVRELEAAVLVARDGLPPRGVGDGGSEVAAGLTGSSGSYVEGCLKTGGAAGMSPSAFSLYDTSPRARELLRVGSAGGILAFFAAGFFLTAGLSSAGGSAIPRVFILSLFAAILSSLSRS
eukprot:CAMPEP_0182864900 /NCGR_PEP_ID=MMETSP0034_2-20130328/7407_1 /TAXON_ID=156128 /ORGANISM="Nephroselmis pyriformis, Strain CCMP717" /LENGTH=360 /DNA_ID=CAMNT_0024997173 /DNA_START=26 /DNA_END=1108 /DNA_ORIENTATION=-